MILLASKSETRRHMLASAGIPFESISAPMNEDAEKRRLLGCGLNPRSVAEGLAQAKALAAGRPRFPVLGADQTLERADGSMLDKPKARDEAEEQLLSLAGRSHTLHAAAAIAEGGEIVWRTTQSATLTMRPFSPAFLRTYLDREYEAIRWSVGGYRIEGVGAQLFTNVEGSHFAILGLPLLPLLDFLRHRGILET